MATNDMNAKLIKFLPELDSVYAMYPLAFNRWLSPNERGPHGEPCFIASTQDAGVRQHYTWGKGPNGAGYYHLLTKVAYTNLYCKIMQSPPSNCCCACSAELRKEMDAWDDVKRLMYNRSVSPIPNDGIAQKAAIAAAKNTAQAWHHGLQNEQLFLGAAGSP